MCSLEIRRPFYAQVNTILFSSYYIDNSCNSHSASEQNNNLNSLFCSLVIVVIALLVHLLPRAMPTVMFLLTVILTNVGQVIGPRCLINVNTPVMC